MAREIHIGSRTISDDEAPWVCAELGHNHQGSAAVAVQMIKEVAKAGAQACKLQKRENHTLYSPQLLDQPYSHEHSYGATYGQHRQALELDFQAYVSCRTVARAFGLAFFATAFDEPSADFLMKLGVPAIKIASGGLTDVPLLTHVASLGVPILLSTGGGGWTEVDRAVELLTAKAKSFALLHCTAAYPVTNLSELNLLAIVEMRSRYPELVIGWSAHTTNISLASAAYAYGARLFEFHFTLDRAGKGTDHGFSLEPKGLATLCENVQKLHVAKGDGEKRWYESEKKPIAKMRRTPQPDGSWIIDGRASSTSSYVS